ncbi:hypothetical protein PCC7424_4706 [Gloeothece citriformis PCC 7424]|uniref:Nif11 domain-containing protein n=1 Tax=Gloeothece citriformis (strain PCC 7424) TaxID=65393 RepID=B7KBT8_GLOC7|nr:Nif11-like leader peptide family natural product precursor [Gloeothece citriformis]ACK73066.1 hypothetical protein PCC7424_4706 [Gloeothece citriformis PCC 7424]
MSQKSVIDFYKTCSQNPHLIENLKQKNFPELILMTRMMGYDFTGEELAATVGAMEVYTITQKMGEAIDAYSSLWPKMWGKSRLEYIINELFNNLSNEELLQLFPEIN